MGGLALQRGLQPKRLLQGGLMVLGGVPYTAFALLLTVADKQVVELLRQGRPHKPPPDPWFYYPLGFGFPGLFAAVGLPRVLRSPRRAPPGELLLWSMVAGSLVILLTPWQALDHRAEGMQLAVAGLAARSLVHEILPRFWRGRAFAAAVQRRLFGYRRRRLRLLSLNVVIILSSLTILALTFASWRTALRDAPAEIYLNRDDPPALAWLRDHASPDQVVLAGPQSAQFVAAYGGTHVVWGEWAFTPNYDAEHLQLSAFFLGQSEPRAYLRNHAVDWLYFGPREAGFALQPGTIAALHAEYHQGETTIYRVDRLALASAPGG
jgi:hypothetical protein